MVSDRNGFRYTANFGLLVLALIIFATIKDKHWQFRILTLFIVIVGVLVNIYFIIGIREPKLAKLACDLEFKYKERARMRKSKGMDHSQDMTITNPAEAKKSMAVMIKSWTGWVKEGNFYVHGIVYMVVRIAVNVSMSVLPFYLITVTGF